MSTPSLAQRRAAHALQCVEAHDGKSYGNYVNYVESLPATILMNGLGQACATLLSKAKRETQGDKRIKSRDPHFLLYLDLQSWICGTDHSAPYPISGTSEDRLMQKLLSEDEAKYLHAQAEALAYLVWLKKFANAYLQKGEDNE